MTATKIQPVAEICSASHDDAQFGERAIKPLCDISGFEYGTPLYAGAAPAAVAGPAEPLVWTPGPNEFKDWCAQWFGPDSDDNYLAEAVHALPPMAQRFARLAAAPALEAPAAPAGFDAWWERAGDGRSKMMAKQAWDAALAAAPQAPRMGEDALHLLRRLLSNQHTLTGPEFRAELEKIVAEESARHAAAPQAPATAIPDEFGTAEHWKEKAQYWAGVAHRLRQEALRGGPVDGIVQPTAPQAPAAPADGLAADVDALLTLLEEKEWAEHCTKTPLGQRLEAAITDMHKEIHAAEERCDVADTLLKRATELHEKGFMPWVEAEELALSEIGIEEAAIDELIREGTHRAVDEDFFLTGADEIRSFTRAVLVHQRMLHSWLSFTKAAPAAPSADERAAYVEFLAGKFPQTYSKEDAEHWWDHGHVSALTWKAARALAAPAAPAVDATSDTALLAAMQRHRIALVPEFEGPWDAEIYNDDAEARPIASGNTPREALRAALAAQAAAKGA